MIFIRRLVIAVAEIVMLFFIVAVTGAGVIFGEYVNFQTGTFPIGDLQVTSDVAKWMGGIAGFVVGAFISATYFALVEIANNTRMAVR
jgi:hypothetical protein